MVTAFEQLHAEGWAHSIEVWQDEGLVGGLYGLAIGTALFGESMYSDAPNASKFCLVLLDRLMSNGHLGLVDCQVQSSHLLSLGASMIARDDFIERLDALCEPVARFESWPNAPINVLELLAK